MPYRAMALVAASLLFATQCYAETKLYNNSKSNTFKQAPQTGGGTKAAKSATIDGSKNNNYRQGSTTSGGGAGAAKSATVNGSKSNTWREGSPINNSKSNTFRMGGGGGGAAGKTR